VRRLTTIDHALHFNMPNCRLRRSGSLAKSLLSALSISIGSVLWPPIRFLYDLETEEARSLQRYAVATTEFARQGSIAIWTKADLGAPFRARATHVVQLGPVAITHIYNQIVNDPGEVGDGLNRLASKTRLCEPARRSQCDRTGG
jgi:hypothetical protein